MKMLVWHSKGGDMYYAAFTPAQEAAAYMAVFKTMEEDGDYKSCPPEEDAKRVFALAQAGDPKAARAFLNHRKDYEYEGISIEDVIDPLAVKA